MKKIKKYKNYVFFLLFTFCSIFYMNSCKINKSLKNKAFSSYNQDREFKEELKNTDKNKKEDINKSFSNYDNLNLQEDKSSDTKKDENSDINSDIDLSSIDYPKKDEKNTQKNLEEKIFVYICGEIKNPGIYEISADKRIAHLIEIAGGFTENANKNYINLALRLSDEQKIYIPNINEDVTKLEDLEINNLESSKYINNTNNTNKINLNKADINELMSLKGIGLSKAKQIISYRNENGGFKNIEEIMNIKGIKKSAFNKIKNDIYVK